MRRGKPARLGRRHLSLPLLRRLPPRQLILLLPPLLRDEPEPKALEQRGDGWVLARPPQLVDVALDIRDLVMRLDAEHIHVPIVACGITSDARAAVAAIHAGAKEYIPLPPDPELIAAVLAAVANDSRDLVYRDEAMAKVIKLAQQIAGSDASVMITGESGTGKEVLARYVHSRSLRAKRPFISINCAAIPENLIESELFGYDVYMFQHDLGMAWVRL